MKITLLIPALAACAFAQDQPRVMTFNYAQAGTTTITGQIGAGPVGVGAMLGEAVKGAPYSATIVTETNQTLADGTHIVQKNQGAVARDSQGRMRHEAILPVIGNMSAANPPKMTFINDPMTGVTYSLNGAEKTYRKMSVTVPDHPGQIVAAEKMTTATADKLNAEHRVLTTSTAVMSGEAGVFTMKVPAPPPGAGADLRGMKLAAEAQVKNESLGSKVIDGVMAEGTRSTRTIAAGEIGNDKAIDIVSESWYSPELKTVISSKRSDPRTGDMIYSLTNISRAEPDASMFTVPADYKAAPENGSRDVIFYKQKED